MVTRVQRKVLMHMIAEGGQVIIATGHKTTRFGEVETSNGKVPVIACSMNVLDGLKSNKYVDRADVQTYRITQAGKRAAVNGRIGELRKALT